jgi:hypothetical protein
LLAPRLVVAGEYIDVEVDGGTWESHGHVDFERRFIFLNDGYALDPSPSM